MAEDRRYDEDEVRAIIDRALEAQSKAGVSHQDLLAIGAGVGLSPETLENAAREIAQARLTETALRQVVRRRRGGVLAHALVFLAVNASLFLVNFLTTPGQWWVLFPVVLWGLGLLLHASFALSRGVSAARLDRERRRLRSPSASAKPQRFTDSPRDARVARPEALPPADPADPQEEATSASRAETRR
jgi:hypothetical protein